MKAKIKFETAVSLAAARAISLTTPVFYDYITRRDQVSWFGVAANPRKSHLGVVSPIVFS